jgi:hypothetical protein
MSSYFEAVGGRLNGTIGVKLLDPADPNTTAHIIRIVNPLDVKVVWTLDGDFASYVGGRWDLRLSCKQIDGTGPAMHQLGTATIPLDTAPAVPLPRRYIYTFRVPAGRLEAGVYQMTVVVQYHNAGFDGAISGFAETGAIEFYGTPAAASTPGGPAGLP